MTLNGWLQIVIILATVLLAAVPLGYLHGQGLRRQAHLALAGDRSRRARTSMLWRASIPRRSRAGAPMRWRCSLFNAAGFALLYAILRLQGFLPFNPQGFGALSPDLAFNTAVSFVTNTNWQSYGGETTMSHFSQMAGLTVQNFLSAATGLALAVALVRGFARSKAATVGNFWVDMTRSTLYVLLPLSVVTRHSARGAGMPQTMLASVDATTLEGAKQTIALGPSQARSRSSSSAPMAAASST